MAEPSDGQSRLDKIVRQIAGLMVAEVCSIYLKRQDGSLELFATEGLNPGAVHNTFMKRGEGLVGRCAELAVPDQRAGRAEPPRLLLSAGDGRGDLSLVPGGADPARRRRAGRARRCRTSATRNTPTRTSRCCRPRPWCWPSICVSGAVAGANTGVGVQPRGRPRRARPADLGRPGARPRRAARAARRRHRARGRGPGGGGPPARHRHRGAEGLRRRDARAGRPGRAPASTATCSRPTACSPTIAGWLRRMQRGDQARHDGGGRRRAGAERHARAHAAPDRCLLARAPARPRRAVRPPAAHPCRRGPAAHASRRQLAARHRPGRPHHGRRPTCSTTTARACAAWCSRTAAARATSPSSPRRWASPPSAMRAASWSASTQGNPDHRRRRRAARCTSAPPAR